MATRQQFVSGISWNTLTVVFQVIIQLVYTGLLARMISETSFGIMGIVLAIMGFAEIFSQVGIGPALIQRKEIHLFHLNGAFYTSLVLGIFFTSGFIICSGWIADLYDLPELELIIQVVCTSFIISAIAVVPRSMLIKSMDFRKYFIAGMISIVGGNLVVGLSLAYLGFDIWSYVWALVTQNVLMTVALWILNPVKISATWNWTRTKELMKYGVGSSLFNALNYAATRIDVTLIPLFAQKMSWLTRTEQLRLASMYERSSYVMQQPITIMGKLSDNVLFSGMSRMQDEKERLRHLILAGTNMIGCVIIPATVFVIMFSSSIIRIYLGDNFNDAIPVFRVLFGAVVFRVFSRIYDALLRARGKVYIGSWIKFVYLLLMGLGIYFSIPYGMVMVAASIVVVTMIHYLMNAIVCHSIIDLGLGEWMRSLKSPLMLGIICLIFSVAGHFTTALFAQGALLRLLTGMFICGGGLMGVVWLFPGILGPRNWNPIFLLPLRMQNSRLVSRMISRIGGQSA